MKFVEPPLIIGLPRASGGRFFIFIDFLLRSNAGGFEWVMDFNLVGVEERPVVICGQGLAGTLLAWELVKRGRWVMIWDEGAQVSSSKVAAGIVTPITGQRVTLTPDLDRFLTEALACYAWTARELGREHFQSRTQVRLWRNEEEPLRFATRRGPTAFESYVAAERSGPLVDLKVFQGTGAGFEMVKGGWLDTRGWLADSAAWFAARGMLRREKLDAAALVPEPAAVRLPDGRQAAAVVFCEGAAARHNPWFPWLKWKCAKGEILTLSIPGLAGEERIVNYGGWLLPVDGSTGRFRAGSTYGWDVLDEQPTADGRAAIEGRLHGLLRVPWEVTGHEAAVRPILHQSLARMGRHPVHPTLAFFNGLGSKGVLHGPRYAGMLAAHLTEGTPLPHSVDVAGN